MSARSYTEVQDDLEFGRDDEGCFRGLDATDKAVKAEYVSCKRDQLLRAIHLLET